MSEWLKTITLLQVLKVGGVVFLYCLMILFVVSVILAMLGVYG